LLLCLGLSSGCGRPALPQVTAMVTLDGQPLPGVLVTFVPEATEAAAPLRSMGISDDSGRLKLQAESRQAGVVAGTHRVIIEDLAILSAPRSDDGTVLTMPQRRFPSLYGDLAQTPLRAEVREDRREIEISLKSK